MLFSLWMPALLLAQPALLLAQPALLLAQPEVSRGDLRLMWYNVENLFHPSDDSLAGDDEFTPEGVRHWTYSRYRQKLTGVARVIVAAGRWDPPEVVGLGEVENAQVLEDLVSHPILEPYHYSYLHREGPDHRGMDIACLFRDRRFKPVGWRAMPPVVSGAFGDTREMVHVRGVWGRRDTLDLFLVHFISSYGGSGATADYRKKQAARLVHLADSVRRAGYAGLMVMAGDFNEPWDGYSLEPLRNSLVGGDTVAPVSPEGPWTSYKYRGIWSGIDQFLIAGGGDRYRIKGSVLHLPVLLTSDETYGGVKPFRTYEGYRYAGGVSDHLPILLDISRPLFSTYSER